MKVTDCLTFSDYYENFPKEIPDFSKDTKYKCGDNIYKSRDDGNEFEQLRSFHSHKPLSYDNWSLHRGNVIHDLNGKYVLISNEFIYFGNKQYRYLGT